MRGNILVVDHAFPKPDQDSGSASTMSYLHILRDAGFKVTFVPFFMADGGAYTDHLHSLGIDTVSHRDCSSFEEAIERVGASQDILLLYRGPVARLALDVCLRRAPNAKVCFHAVDLHFLREQRQAELSGDAAVAEAAERTKSTELEMANLADVTIVVSEFEHQLLGGLVPSARIEQIPILRAAPVLTGVHKLVQRWRDWRRPGGRRDLVFIGGYQHTPNVDAVHWFVDAVWPLLVAKGFRQRLILAGSHVPPSIEALADRQIKVVGHVRHLASLFQRARASIAPLRYGGGVKGERS